MLEAQEISTKDLTGTMGDLPEPTETILDQENKPNLFSGLKDTKGRGFDSEIHVTNENGEPILTTKGKLKLKKRGRPTASGKGDTSDTVENGKSSSMVGGIPTAPNQREIDAMTTGIHAADALIALGCAYGGEEWHPKTEPLDERTQLQQAFGKYFVAKDIADVPPGLALTIAVVSYAAPRFMMPETKQKTKTIGGKLKTWFRWKKFNKEENKKEAAKAAKDAEKKEE